MTLPTITIPPINRSPRAAQSADVSNAILDVLAKHPAGLSVTEIGRLIKPGATPDNITRILHRTQEWLTTARHPYRIRIASAGKGTLKRVTLEQKRSAA